MRFISFIFSFLLFTSVFCQIAKDNVLGRLYTFQTEEVNIDVQVYTPSNDTPKDLLILLDGQRLFGHGVSVCQSFQQFKLSPEFVVAGISTPYPQRFRSFTSGSASLLDFIENTLLPFLAENYRTTKNKVFFGWEYGGSMVFQSLISKPGLFDFYIAASPFPIESKLELLDSLLTDSAVQSPLYFTVEKEPGMVMKGTEAAKQMLERNNNDGFEWKYTILENEEHRSTSYNTLYHGLRNYYSYYPEIQFNTLEEFDDRGGLDFVYDYYKRRGEQYNFSQSPIPWTMFSITRTAMRANNYDRFDLFVNEFEASGFLNKIRIGRALSIADFYQKNGNSDKAIQIYMELAKSHPDSPDPLLRLGNVYESLGDKRKSKTFYDQAKKIPNNSGD